MKEIGGYIEFERHSGEMLHEKAIRLNSGRSCLAYLIEARRIKKLYIPYYLCDCIEETCRANNVEYRYYRIKSDFTPEDIDLEAEAWLYVVNYYGQLARNAIEAIHRRYKNVILDNAHAYFSMPIDGIDTLYTCRKYFGVPDGGILYTDQAIEVGRVDRSYDRIGFLAGRYELDGTTFFADFQRNEEHFYGQPVMRMSALTENLLRAIDYDAVKRAREENFNYLRERLKTINRLDVAPAEGAFMYPLLLEHGAALRRKLIRHKIYIPTLWPNVADHVEEDSIERLYSADILPLPCDQRYSTQDMRYVADMIFEMMD